MQAYNQQAVMFEMLMNKGLQQYGSCRMGLSTNVECSLLAGHGKVVTLSPVLRFIKKRFKIFEKIIRSVKRI